MLQHVADAYVPAAVDGKALCRRPVAEQLREGSGDLDVPLCASDLRHFCSSRRRRAVSVGTIRWGSKAAPQSSEPASLFILPPASPLPFSATQPPALSRLLPCLPSLDPRQADFLLRQGPPARGKPRGGMHGAARGGGTRSPLS